MRDARSLAPAQPDTRQFVVLTAARLGKARLIDNLQFTALNRASRRARACSASAQATCSRTSADGSSRRAASAAVFAAVAGALPSATAMLRSQRS